MADHMSAAGEYASRPKDERYSTFQGMIDAARQDEAICEEKVYNLRDLRITVPPELADARTGADARALTLQSPLGEAVFTSYSFDQLCSTTKAPAGFMRQLPSQLCADVLNQRMHDWAPHGTKANVLIRDNEADPFPVIRACTSETYGRLWDGRLYGQMSRWFGDGARSNGGTWQSPPTWEGGLDGPRGGQYRGDRDSFVLRIDGGSIVGDPRGWNRPTGNGSHEGKLWRGIMVRNSEVGECSVTIECVLFDFVCGNHILWGALVDRKYRRRHVGKRIDADVMSELMQIARRYNERSASQDEQIIRALVTHEIAKTKDAVIDELCKLDYTRADAKAAYETCEEKEPNLNPRSFWGIAAGTTRLSQFSGYQDERLELDHLASQVLKSGQKQYAMV